MNNFKMEIKEKGLKKILYLNDEQGNPHNIATIKLRKVAENSEKKTWRIIFSKDKFFEGVCNGLPIAAVKKMTVVGYRGFDWNTVEPDNSKLLRLLN